MQKREEQGNMAQTIVPYAVVHQPRRLKLPAQPIPKGASPEDICRCLFDEKLNKHYFKKVAQKCYYPATTMFQNMVEEGFKLSLGFSLSFIKQAEEWDPVLLERFRHLVGHPNVELTGVEPYHSFIFYLDINTFVDRMRWMVSALKEIFGVEPEVTDTTEMFLSNEIYYALGKAGFKGALLDGREWVMGWRQPSYLYRYDGGPYLLARHYQLSDDVGYRFSNKSWSGYPLFAETYADWLSWTEGDMILLGWDFETFGEHHWEDTGIFDFMRQLVTEVHRRKMSFLTTTEAIEKFKSRSHYLPLPEFPSTWAGEGGTWFFLGNSAQQSVFQLMHHAYHKAKLTEDPKLIDLALWLCQSDNLHLIQWFQRVDGEAEVSAYFTPNEWWQLEPGGIIWEIQQVYKNFINALDPHVKYRVADLKCELNPVPRDILVR